MIRTALTILLVCILMLVSMDCKTRKEREAEQARLDSLYNDSVKAANPYKPSSGIDQYNRQREAMGDINKYTTPEQPKLPERK